jgi:hypothetical protein
MMRLYLLLLGAACMTTPSLRQFELVRRDAEGGDLVIDRPGHVALRIALSALDGSPVTSGEKDTVREAFTETMKIVDGDRFRAHVRSDGSWLAAIDNRERLSGDEVLRAYPDYLPRTFAVVIVRSSGAGENASTGCDPPAIKTYTTVLDEWHSPATRPLLINTLAHEMTHLIAQRSRGTLQGAFLDRLFSLHPCKEGDLVSYKIGNMAECTAREPGEDFAACMKTARARMKRRLWAVCGGKS